jgi:hypothetical protein
MVIFTCFFPVVGHVPIVLLMIKIPVDTMALVTTPGLG